MCSSVPGGSGAVVWLTAGSASWVAEHGPVSDSELASVGLPGGKLRWVTRRVRPQRSLGAHGAALPGTGCGSLWSLSSLLSPCSASALSRPPSATARRPPGGTARVSNAFISFPNDTKVYKHRADVLAAPQAASQTAHCPSTSTSQLWHWVQTNPCHIHRLIGTALAWDKYSLSFLSLYALILNILLPLMPYLLLYLTYSLLIYRLNVFSNLYYTELVVFSVILRDWERSLSLSYSSLWLSLELW